MLDWVSLELYSYRVSSYHLYGNYPFDDDSVQFVNMMRMSMGMLLLREINQNFNKRTQLF